MILPLTRENVDDMTVLERKAKLASAIKDISSPPVPVQMNEDKSHRNRTLLTVALNFIQDNLRNMNDIGDITSFLPNFYNKTTSVEDGLFYVINLITSFFAKGLLRLGNEVRAILAFIPTTEVVLFAKLVENEVFVRIYSVSKQLKI